MLNRVIVLFDFEGLTIRLDGTCRNADIEIDVEGKQLVKEENCGSNSEWKP